MIPPLQGAASIYLDSASIIYFVEEHRRYLSVGEPLVEAIDRGDTQGITSYVTLSGVMVKPLMTGRYDLAERYRDLLLGSLLHIVAIDAVIAEQAARIRAQYLIETPAGPRPGFRLADALQLAAALVTDAELFLTNDERLRRFSEVRVIVLSDYLSPP